MTLRPIQERAAFDFIRYSNVWEDADILCAALKPGAKGQRLLSIASAGDNALALLTLDPKEVVAADLNPAQLACLELRVAAFQALTHEQVLAFLGVTPDPQRLRTYQGLRQRLSPEARAFWDAQAPAIEEGAMHSGKLERFLQGYQRQLKRWVHGPENIRTLLQAKAPADRVRYFDHDWNSWRWRLLNRLAFSRQVMGRRGRDPEFFRHADSDVTSGPSRRFEGVLTRLSTHDNPYLTYHLTGNYAPGALPLYLRPQHYAAIRRRSHRIRPFLGSVETAPGTFRGFNLSNIFEYMDDAQHQRTYSALVKKARPGARLAYWNLHVRRSRPQRETLRMRPLALAKRLHAQDKNWAYQAFHVDQRSAA